MLIYFPGIFSGLDSSLHLSVMLLGAGEEYAADHKGRIKDRGLRLVPFMTVTHFMQVSTESCTHTQKIMMNCADSLRRLLPSHV